MLMNKVIRVCGKLMRPYWNKTQSKSLGRALTTGKCSCFSNISQSTRREHRMILGPWHLFCVQPSGMCPSNKSTDTQKQTLRFVRTLLCNFWVV